MTLDDIKSISISVKDKDRKYNYRFRGDSIDNWSDNFFTVFLETKWPNYRDDLKIEIDEKNDNLEEIKNKSQQIKINKKKFLKIVSDFLYDINLKNNNYSFESKVSNNYAIQGYYNNKNFWIYPNEIITVKTPSFKNLEDKFKYLFERDLVDYNFYIPYLREYYLQPNKAYEDDENFMEDLKFIVNSYKHKFDYVNNKEFIKEFEIEPLKERIDKLENEAIKKDLLKYVSLPDLDFENYSDIGYIISIVKNFSYENPIKQVIGDDYYYYSSGREHINTFNNFIYENKEIGSLFDKSLNQRETIQFYTPFNTENMDFFIKQIKDKEAIVSNFMKNNAEDVIKLYLDKHLNIQTNQLNKKR